MKKIIIFLCVMLVSGALNIFTSCTDDLDAFPYNETDFTSENAYGSDFENYLSGLAKIYLSWSNTADLQVDDGGASELFRAYWSIQECSTDACKNNWTGDAWTQDVNQNTWSTASNAATYAVYARTLHGITYVNEYLRQTTDDRLQQRGCSEEVIAKVHQLREEARFVRAYMYWIAIDTFGDVPFVTENSAFGAVTPEVGARADVFDYIVDELVDITSDESPMAEAGTQYPRATKGSALGLLSRVYLNAEVYTSTVDASGNVTAKGAPMWQECKDVCEEIFEMNYGLCSDYFHLFRGDNGENPDARQEMLFSLFYDTNNNFSWGGSYFLLAASNQGADQIKDDEGNSLYYLGMRDSWAGIRMPYEYVSDYFGVTVPEDAYAEDGTYTGEYEYTDDRASEFYIKGHYEEMTDIGVFSQGWSFYKYNNRPHDKTMEEYAEVAAGTGQPNVDIPLIRLGEIYLNYAEACLNLNQAGLGVPYLNDLRERADLLPISTYDQDYLVKERAVELAWESLRRTDLIRWDLFHSSTFIWKWKGGSYNGQGFPEYKLVFDFPDTELVSNSNLSHKPGYN